MLKITLQSLSVN